jgi:mRNA interferase MazF
LASSRSSRTPARGEIWIVDLDPVQGREQAGRRPALIISVDPFNRSAAELLIVVPLTSRDKGIRSHVAVPAGEGGLDRPSFVKCEDVRSISIRRLWRHLGSVSETTLKMVEARLRILMGL